MTVDETGAERPPILAIAGIDKRFGRTHAVRGVDLVLREGEFVGLMGPNGAGKSTLIKMLSGVYDADAGTITLNGRPVKDLAGRPEVGFVHQDLGLVDSMSVMDNLRLGAKPIRVLGPVLHRGRELAVAQAALDRVGLAVPLTANVATLSPGEKALLAVARLLGMGARLIVVDETTSTLPPRESRWFVDTLRAATTDGTCVLMVSHKLSELLSAAQRVVMLIDGQKVADQLVSPEDQGAVVRLLASHEEQVAEAEQPETTRREPGKELLALRGARLGALGPLDLSVRAGEVVGLTGLVGSGLHSIGLLAHGALKPTSGDVYVAAGVPRALVAPQRETHGGIAELPVLWNATLASLPRWRSLGRLLRLTAERSTASTVLTDLRVVPNDPDKPFGNLSGGNQQKVLFARTLLQQAGIYVLCEPTRGVDVRTRREIYRLIGRLRNDGAAVLVVTSDSEDLFAVCDRIGVLSTTGLSPLWEASELSEDQLTEVL